MTVNLNQEKIIFINCYILPIKTEHRIKLWNNMCKSLPSYLNKMIYTRDDFNEIMKDKTPLELINAIDFERFNVKDEFFSKSPYDGKYESSNHISNFNNYNSDCLIEYLISVQHESIYCYCDNIKEHFINYFPIEKRRKVRDIIKGNEDLGLLDIINSNWDTLYATIKTIINI